MFDRMGPVRYRTPDLDRMVRFYHEVLGFAVRGRTDSSAAVGSPDRDLLLLDQDDTARRVEKATGLYHTAFLFPQHRDLVHLLGRIATTRTPVEGFNHHGTHEAIYLPDPDGNGIELAWDLPQAEWPLQNGQLDFFRHDKVFDPQAILAEFETDKEPWPGIPAGSRVGHVHLHMANLVATQKFYTEGLGLDVVLASSRHGMLFVSFDGYHHHVGNNLWKGPGLPPAPADAIGLVEYTLKVDDLPATRKRLESQGYSTAERSHGFSVKDASGIGVVITA